MVILIDYVGPTPKGRCLYFLWRIEMKLSDIKKKISWFLGRRWWAGLAVIFVLVMAIIERPVSPLKEKLQYLNNSASEPYIVPDFVETDKIGYQTVQLIDNSKIVIDPKIKEWKIDAKELKIGENVEINARGNDGPNRKRAENGQNAHRDCQRGQNGEPGKPGINGDNGADITIRALTLILEGPLKIDTSGGKGGNGGNGGNGGRGGRADRSEGCKGGDGGDGGNGGNGGDGGNGGNVIIYYSKAFELRNNNKIKIDDYNKVEDFIIFTSKGGESGKGGLEGVGGAGGPGRGAVLFGAGEQPPGNDGNNGNPGVDGKPSDPDKNKTKGTLYIKQAVPQNN